MIKIGEEWEKYEASPESASMPAVVFKTVKMPVGKPAVTIHEKYYDDFARIYLSKNIATPDKTADDFSSEDIATRLGLNNKTATYHFNKLRKAWQEYEETSGATPKPAIPYRVVKNKKGLVVDVIDRSDLENFAETYSPKSFEREVFQSFLAEQKAMTEKTASAAIVQKIGPKQK